MKICTTCGGEYTDDTEECPRDGTLLFAHAPAGSAADDEVEGGDDAFASLSPMTPNEAAIDGMDGLIMSLDGSDPAPQDDAISSAPEPPPSSDEESFMAGVFGVVAAEPSVEVPALDRGHGDDLAPSSPDLPDAASGGAGPSDTPDRLSGPILVSAAGDGAMEPVDLSALIDEELPEEAPKRPGAFSDNEVSSMFPTEATMMGGGNTESNVPKIIAAVLIILLIGTVVGAYFLLPKFGVELPF